MATHIERDSDGMSYCYALTDYVKRGNFYSAYSNDGKSIIVYYGSHLGYPMGDSVLQINKEDVDCLIAALKSTIINK